MKIEYPEVYVKNCSLWPFEPFWRIKQMSDYFFSYELYLMCINRQNVYSHVIFQITFYRRKFLLVAQIKLIVLFFNIFMNT